MLLLLIPVAFKQTGQLIYNLLFFPLRETEQFTKTDPDVGYVGFNIIPFSLGLGFLFAFGEKNLEFPAAIL